MNPVYLHYTMLVLLFTLTITYLPPIEFLKGLSLSGDLEMLHKGSNLQTLISHNNELAISKPLKFEGLTFQINSSFVSSPLTI